MVAAYPVGSVVWTVAVIIAWLFWIVGLVFAVRDVFRRFWRRGKKWSRVIIVLVVLVLLGFPLVGVAIYMLFWWLVLREQYPLRSKEAPTGA